MPTHLHDLLIADMVTHHQFNCLVMWLMSSRLAIDSGLIQLYGGDQIKLGVPCRGIRSQKQVATYIMYTSHALVGGSIPVLHQDQDPIVGFRSLLYCPWPSLCIYQGVAM